MNATCDFPLRHGGNGPFGSPCPPAESSVRSRTPRPHLFWIAFTSLFLLGICPTSWIAGQEGDADQPPADAQAAAAAPAPPPPSKWWALLIAAEDYDLQTSGQMKLDYCFEDMAALRKNWLLATGVPAEQIVFLHDQAGPQLRPTKANIERELRALADRLTPENVLIVGAALHGIQREGRSCLCPIDTVLKPGAGGHAPQEANLIELPAVFETVRGCSAAFKLLVFDACRESLSLAKGEAEAVTGQRREFIASLNRLKGDTRGLAVLTSCSEGQSAYEDHEIHHGVFIHSLVEGLEGNADLYDGNNDGIVSLREAASYANRRTKTRIYLKYDRWQEPDLLLGASTANFPLVVLDDRPKPGAVEDDLTFMQRYGDLLLRWTMLGKAKQYDLSIDLLTQVLRSQPENRTAYARRGAAYRAKGDYNLALADYTKAGTALELFVKYEEIALAVEGKPQMPVPAGVRLSISQIQDDWLWVNAVDNDPSGRLRGWVQKDYVTWDPGLAEQALPMTPQRHTSEGAVVQRLIGIAHGLNYVPSFIPSSLSLPGIPSIPGIGSWAIPTPRSFIPSVPSVPSMPSIPSIPRPSIPGIPSIPSFRGLGSF